MTAFPLAFSIVPARTAWPIGQQTLNSKDELHEATTTVVTQKQVTRYFENTAVPLALGARRAGQDDTARFFVKGRRANPG
jgi:hypothetical protein